MKIISAHIHKDIAKGVQREYSIYFVPRRTTVCEKILEEEKVHQLLTIGEYPLYIIPLDEDVLSFELDLAYRVGVIATPDVHSFDLSERDNFIILGCDGLWGVFGPSDAVDFVQQHLRLSSKGDVRSRPRLHRTSRWMMRRVAGDCPKGCVYSLRIIKYSKCFVNAFCNPTKFDHVVLGRLGFVLRSLLRG
ncbi:hypothetical protein Syun_006752 [Stephania yunnanensis]|uniref:PPM-type phosphatase domain-containing protein n=1 Tax=Stephania yunnanensis TaxID=152371 RepID=A0AAP0KXG6_9MAGN